MQNKILRNGRWMTMAEIEEDNEKFGEQRKRAREEKIRMLRMELKKLEEEKGQKSRSPFWVELYEADERDRKMEKKDAEWEAEKKASEYRLFDSISEVRNLPQEAAFRAAVHTARNLGQEHVLDDGMNPKPETAYDVLFRLWNNFADAMEETEAERSVLREFSSWWAEEKKVVTKSNVQFAD